MPVRVTMTGSATEPQLVKCLFCRREFVSELTVTRAASADTAWGISEAAAAGEAAESARAQVFAALANLNLCDAVPCPGCAQYQPHMARQMNATRYRGVGCAVAWPLVALGSLFAILGAVGLIVGEKNQNRSALILASGFGATLAGVLLLWLLRRSAHNHDPNDGPEGPRRREAEERTQTVDEYDRKQQRRVQTEYAEYTPRHRDGNPFAELEPLVVVWWVRPTVFTNGGAFTIVLSQTQFVTFTVPEIARPGVVLDPSMCPPGVRPFKVLVRAFRVHPDEYQPV